MSGLSPSLPAPGGEFLLYQTEDGRTRLQVRLEAETVWLALSQMAELFQRDKSVISRHIRNVFDEGELARDRVVANSATTAADGKTYKVDYYNLDVVIAVGYRVRSRRGTQFRTWATHGSTAAEVIHERADARKPHMGLSTTRPGGIVRKVDVTIAKNYLTESELQVLNRIVTLYLEYAELQALERKAMNAGMDRKAGRVPEDLRAQAPGSRGAGFLRGRQGNGRGRIREVPRAARFAVASRGCGI